MRQRDEEHGQERRRGAIPPACARSATRAANEWKNRTANTLRAIGDK
jgi:hypothetical protein